MSSFYCLSCESHVFRIISDQVDEYCCLRQDCDKFKLSVCAAATGIYIGPDIVIKPEPQDHPSLVSQYHPMPESRPRVPVVAGPSSQPSSEQASGAVRENVPAAAPEASRVEAFSGINDDVIVRILQAKPLSEHHIVVADPIAGIRRWATRSVERRRVEALYNRKVKKPYNAFILYTVAYTETANKLLRNCNQMPSMIFALLTQSWRMESGSIRAQFFGFSGTERMLHGQAFPSYKVAGRRHRI